VQPKAGASPAQLRDIADAALAMSRWHSSPIRIRGVRVPTPRPGVTVTRNQGCGNDGEVLTDDARLRP
jgi:hypothetical protein